MEEKNEFLTPDRDYGIQILNIVRSGASDEEMRELLSEYHENDIAGVFEELDAEERERLFDILGIEVISDIVPYLDDVGEYLSEIDADDAAEIIEQMDADEALEARCAQAGIRVMTLGRYYNGPVPSADLHCLVVNYSGLRPEQIWALEEKLKLL